MEAINYIPGGKNMILSEDAQMVQGVSGNGCYLPIGTGTIALAGDRNELSVSLWRQWDGVVEQDAERGVFSFKNIQGFFDRSTDLLTIVINGFKAITDIKDDQKQAHWCFTFAKNNRFTVYKDAKAVYELLAGDKPVDMAEGFILGGGKTHATFDEVRLYKTVLTQGEVNGLFYLVSKGTQIKQLESLVQGYTPKYLGVAETVPTTRTAIITKGERLGAQDANPGDWVLMAQTSGGWKCGVCYRWTGTLWVNLEPEANYVEQYHACLLHICEIPELMKNTGHFGALFAKVIVAQEAFIKKLAADQAFLKELIVQRLRIDSDKNSDTDFEAWFDKDNGLKIKNKGEEIFSVSPEGNAKMKKATFSGEIKCDGFQVLNINMSSDKKELFSWNAGATGHDCIKRILKVNFIPFEPDKTNAIYYGEGQYGSDIIRVIKTIFFIAPYTDISHCYLTLISNNGTKVATIQSSINKEGVYITWTDKIFNYDCRYLPSLHDFVFYEYIAKQKVILPNISFGKSAEKNVLYRDENGFIKIS